MSNYTRCKSGSRFHGTYFPQLEGFARGIAAKVIDAIEPVSGGDGKFGAGAVDKVRAAQEKRERKAAKAAENAARAAGLAPTKADMALDRACARIGE